MLDDSELQMLSAILEEALIQSKERNDVDLEYHEIDVNNLNIFNDKLIESQVYDSLAMKDFIECSGYEDEKGDEILEYVSITPKGLVALKSLKGVH
jgi:hypothetical protein